MQADSPLLLVAQGALIIIPLALSLAVQQLALCRVAAWLGDDTAVRAGRATLNPLVHIDPLGTVALPLLLVLLQGQGGLLPLLGWAKPAPIDLRRMSPRLSLKARRLAVAATAPLASFALAALAALGLVLTIRHGTRELAAFTDLASKLLSINAALSVFQLLPIGSLSGFTLLTGLLPARLVPPLEAFNERYGQWLLLGLLVFGRGLLGPPIRFVAGALLTMVSACL